MLTLIASAGAGLYLLAMAGLGRWAATHYARRPGARWGVWE